MLSLYHFQQHVRAMKQARGSAQAPTAIHADKSGPAPMPMGPGALTRLQSGLTGGAALPPTTRARLSSSFGADLSDIRVHTGAAASETTAATGSVAVTIGTDIAFAQGQFRPGTQTGDHLIAEEVAHSLQQLNAGQTAVQRRAAGPVFHDGAEVAARVAADRAVLGQPARLSRTQFAERPPTTRDRLANPPEAEIEQDTAETAEANEPPAQSRRAKEEREQTEAALPAPEPVAAEEPDTPPVEPEAHTHDLPEPETSLPDDAANAEAGTEAKADAEPQADADTQTASDGAQAEPAAAASDAAPSGPVSQENAAEITGPAPLPRNTGPVITDLATRFQSTAATARDTVSRSAEAGVQSLGQRRDTLIGRMSATVGGLHGSLAQGIQGLFQRLITSRDAADASASAQAEQSRARAESEETSARGLLDIGFTATTTLADTTATADAAILDAHGETTAGRARTAASTNATNARNTGERYAGQYGGEAGDEGRSGARAHAAEVADSMIEQGELISQTASADATQMSGELTGGVGDILEQIGVTQSGVEESLAAVTPMVTQGIDQTLGEVTGEIHTQTNESSRSLGTIEALVHGALDRTMGYFTGLAHLATAKGSAALDMAAQDRIRPIAEAEAEVMQTLEGVPDDPTGEIAEDLAEIEAAMLEAASAGDAELVAGTQAMTDDLDAGATATEDNLSEMTDGALDAGDESVSGTEDGLNNTLDTAGGVFERFIDDVSRAIQEGIDCVLMGLAIVAEALIRDLGLAETDAEGQIDDKTDQALEAQEEETFSLAEYLAEELAEYRAEGGFIGFLADVLLFVVAVIEAFVGIIAGLIYAVLMFILGIILLIVGIVVLLFALGFAIGVLAVTFFRCFNVVVALILTIVAAILLVIAAILAILALLIVAIGAVLYSIVTNIIKAFSADGGSPFERGFLIGQAIGDILLLLLPFKGKVKFRLPGWLAEIVGRIGARSRLLVEIFVLCEGRLGVMQRLVRTFAGDLEALLVLLRRIGSGSMLDELLAGRGMTLERLDQLLTTFGDDAALLLRYLRFAGRDAELLATLLRLSGNLDEFRRLMTICGDDAALLRRLFTNAGDDVAELNRLLGLVDDDARLLAELLEAVGDDVARLEALLDLADTPAQLAKFLRGVDDLNELQRIMELMRQWQIPMSDIEWVIDTQGDSPLDAFRFFEGLLVENGRVRQTNANELRAILQAWREGILRVRPRRTRSGRGGDEPNIDFAAPEGAGGAIRFTDTKTPAHPRFRSIADQSRDIAEGVAGYDADVRVIIDLRNLPAADKPVFIQALRTALSDNHAKNLTDLIDAGRVVFLNAGGP